MMIQQTKGVPLCELGCDPRVSDLTRSHEFAAVIVLRGQLKQALSIGPMIKLGGFGDA